MDAILVAALVEALRLASEAELEEDAEQAERWRRWAKTFARCFGALPAGGPPTQGQLENLCALLCCAASARPADPGRVFARIAVDAEGEIYRLEG